ncbi:MAG: HEAT repeat domain-containing protein [Stenomitos rutilans HA7619-LM2]|jgi:HEAT repeat protein/energy-coupling factor transporter ATP-binding protein EcfA2|nr:HEAT repeat domain-containing protein [Stenomitos rutilans HA7619-LM2]
MFTPEELIAIVERIKTDIHSDADLQVLQQMSGNTVAAGTRSLAITGDANGAAIATGNGNTILNIIFQADGVQIDDRRYQGAGAEALRAIIQEILRPTLEIDWQQVSRSFLDEQLRLTTNPLTAGEGISYRTEQVYVPLGLVERKRQTRRGEDVSPEQGSLLYEEIEITQRFENEQFLEQVLQHGQSPNSRGKRIAIIGEPGAGKTTVLQQIAQWVSGHVEGAIAIWVPLADLRGQELEPYLLEQWLQATVRRLGQAEASDQVKDAFVTQCQQGRVWLLLDGVDEMQISSSNPLAEIARQVRIGGLLSQARIVLSCRLNLWDGDRHALLDTFDTYRTLEFSYPQQVEQFIGQCFGALQEDQEGHAERLCTVLKAPGKERIRDLVKNPLRLTLLCFNWYLGEGTLPETKAGLYEQFVADFYEWKREQFPTTVEQRRQLNAALGELAREAIDKEATRFRLRQEFVCEFLGEPDELDSMFQIALRLGWMNQVGVDIENRRKAMYAFFHPTFQEYFAALAIDDWHFFLNHIPKDPSHFDASYRVFESRWKEVFLLWLGREDRSLSSQKEALKKALVTFKDKCKGFYSDQSFLLAAAGIAEFKDCSYADAIINQLVQWMIGSSNWLKQGWTFLFDYPREEARIHWAATTFGSVDPQRMIRILVQVLETNQDKNIRRRAVESLSKIGAGNERAIQALVQILETIQDRHIHWITAKSLGEIGMGNERAIQALVQILKTTQDQHVHWITAESLGKVNSDNERAVQALIQILEATQDEDTSWITASILGKISPDNERAIQALVQILETTQDEDTRWRVIDKLGEIGTGNERAIQALVQILETTQDEDTRLIATENLGKIGIGNETATRMLMQVLETTQNEYICWKTANSLGKVGVINDERAIHELMRLLETTQSSYICWRTANSLSEIDTGNEITIQALVRVLETTRNEYTRRSTIECLSKIGTNNERTIKFIVQSLRRYLRTEKAFELMVKCAETLSYQAFYQVFHASR